MDQILPRILITACQEIDLTYFILDSLLQAHFHYMYSLVSSLQQELLE